MEVELNIWSILVSAIAMFAVAAFWYTVPFGKLWGKIHGFNKLSKAEQKKAQSSMGPWYLVSFAVTVFTAGVLVFFMAKVSSLAFYQLAFLVWLGFMFMNDQLVLRGQSVLSDAGAYDDSTLLENLLNEESLQKLVNDPDFMHLWQKHEYYTVDGRVAKWEGYSTSCYNTHYDKADEITPR